MSRYAAPVSLVLCLLATACSSSAASAQDDDGSGGKVPAAVLANLEKKYPAATSLEWERDRNGSYEAQFEVSGQKVRADFDPDGTWIETEESVKWKELPEAVREAFEREYDKDDIVELEHTVNAEKGEFYDVEIDPKGEKKFDVEYRPDGTRIN